MKNTTIQDIADAAGVSKSTVSRVLNGTASVHPEKRRAVLDAQKRLGFQPNIVATSLARGRSMTIGVLTQIIGSPFYDTIAQGVIGAIQDTNYSPMFVDGRWQTSEEVKAIRLLLGRRVDGLILIGGSLPGGEISELCGSLPTVVVARRLDSNQHHCIFMDNIEGGYLATKHLIDQGHREIAIVKGLPHHQDAIDRHQGYERAHQEAELEVDPRRVLPGDFSAEAGLRAVDHLVENGVPFTAVVAANDLTAFGVRLGLDRHGMKVPEQVSLVGFDDQMESAYMTPPLTTVRQPAREMGEQAAKAVIELIDGEPFATVMVRGELMVRESVSTPPCSEQERA